MDSKTITPKAPRAWVAPRVETLPALTQLTLQTGIPGDCVPGDPSSCFG
jgi:hypothetical protein